MFDNYNVRFPCDIQVTHFSFTPLSDMLSCHFMLGCHFILVSLFNSRNAWMGAWMINFNELHFCGLNPVLRGVVCSSSQRSEWGNNSLRKHGRSTWNQWTGIKTRLLNSHACKLWKQPSKGLNYPPPWWSLQRTNWPALRCKQGSIRVCWCKVSRFGFSSLHSAPCKTSL